MFALRMARQSTSQPEVNSQNPWPPQQIGPRGSCFGGPKRSNREARTDMYTAQSGDRS